MRIVVRIKAKYIIKDFSDIDTFLKVCIVYERSRYKVTLVYNDYIERIAKRFDFIIVTRLLYIPLPKK